MNTNKKQQISIRKFTAMLLTIGMLLSLMLTPAFADSIEKSVTPESILANCSVELIKSENFQMTDAGVDVSVHLDSSLTNGCYLTIFAYAGNTSFDPDGSYNKRLWSGRVTDGYTGTCQFNASLLPLEVGYKIVGCLNVPVGEDAYRAVTSRSIDVVDENGEGFQDYTYPDASIDETELKAGAASLHISLTGDARIFEAANKPGSGVTVSVVVREYPADAEIDLDEGEDQRTLYGNYDVKETFAGQEVKLSQPLRAGYRVRALVYWSQSVALFLPKGNDYEAVFHKPDDSVLVSGTASQDVVTVDIAAPVYADDETVEITAGGVIPENAILLLKSYESGITQFATDQGTPYGVIAGLTAGTHRITPTNKLAAGTQLVGFILSSGELIAQSIPVTVSRTEAFAVTLKEPLTAESTQAVFQIASNNSTVTNINIVKLCKVNASGNADADSPITQVFGKKPGEVTLDGLAGKLTAGDTVCLVLTYMDGGEISTYESDGFRVAAPMEENSLAIAESSLTTEAVSVTVIVSGCEAFQGGLLILTLGDASNTNDADSRRQIGSKSFTGAGTYTISFSNNALQAGQTVLPHLYRYDSDADATYYKYGAPVTILTAGGQTVEPRVEIATSPVRADREDLWVITNFGSSLTGTLKLYTYTGNTFAVESADEIYSGSALPSENSQRITFGAGKLTAGQKLIAVLYLSDNTQLQSDVLTIQAVPEKQKPTAVILDDVITAGDTYLNASLTFDAGANNASYVLYRFTGDTLDSTDATQLASRILYRSTPKESIYLGTGRIQAGDKLQIVLTVDGEEARSNIMTVEPSPDWGMPYAAFDVAAVQADADVIPVTIDYAAEYLTLGDGFYCDISIYQFSARYTDEEYENGELWENTQISTRIGQVNSNYGEQTKGQIEVPVRDGVTLKPGDRLMIKLRLPHTEWEGEEVDYLSVSVPVIGAGDSVPAAKVVLYNLGTERSRGARLRAILEQLGIAAVELDDGQLNETVGYLAGLDGYAGADNAYTGDGYDTEFMLICNLPESLLDRFLDAMTADGLRIDHKAVVTEYNREYLFYELIGDIADEHDVFQALLALNEMISEAEMLSAETYGGGEGWASFQTALQNANEALASDESTFEQLTSVNDALKQAYLTLIGMTELTGTAVITMEQEENGAYTMTASVKGGTAGTEYQFAWSNGETTQSVSGIAADRLIGTTVTVTAQGKYGKLTAQLMVPEMPKVTITAEQTSAVISWETPVAADNRPLPAEYTAAVYQGETLVKTVSCGSADVAITISDLTADTAYTVKLYARNDVGRSDIQTAVFTTKSEEKTNRGTNSKSASNSERYTFTTPALANLQTDHLPFADVTPGDWFSGAVSYVYESRLMQGVDGASFAPDAVTSRAMLVTILYRLEKEPAAGGSDFYDVANGQYYTAAVAWAAENRIVNGYGDGTFGPNDVITREQLAVILYRYASFKGYDTAARAELTKFSDAGRASGFAVDALSWANAQGLVNGKGGGILDPNGVASRAEAAQMLMNFAGKLAR